MRQNLLYIVSFCFLSLMVSCSDGEDEPSMNVITEPMDNPEEKVASPDVDNLGRTDPSAENVEDLQPDEEMDIPEPVFVEPDPDVDNLGRTDPGVENVEDPQPPKPVFIEPEVEEVDLALLDAIDGVLKRLREGYENENLELYLSAFWMEGFEYTSDMGTFADPFDDVMFDELKDEGKSAARVFAMYQDIELELSFPAHIVNAAPKKVEALNHYRIQGFANEGHVLEGGFLGWFAEGNNKFTFEFRRGEWRITKWIDEAFDAEMIRAGINPAPAAPAAHPGGKLVTMWGHIKRR